FVFAALARRAFTFHPFGSGWINNLTSVFADRSQLRCLQYLLNSVNSRKFVEGQFDVIDRYSVERVLSELFLHKANPKILAQPVFVERVRLLVSYLFWIREGEDQRTRGVVMDVALVMFMITMDVAIENGDIFVRSKHVHDVVAVTGKPLPFRLQ